MNPITHPLVVPARDRRFDLLDIVRREFQQVPTLTLTMAQACRLWAMEASTAAQVLDALVGEGTLRCRQDGRYATTSRFVVA